jgi:hypothetical protein
MKFNSPELAAQVVWNMRQSHVHEKENRAAIDRLADGYPPLSKSDQEKSRAKFNVNWLEMTERLADARRSYYNSFFKPGTFFTVTLDRGPVGRRDTWGKVITREINKLLRTLAYFEEATSQVSMLVTHGIGPVVWLNSDAVIPRAKAISEVLIPANTLRSMTNLTHFALYYEESPMELYLKTHRENVRKGWNMDLVDKAVKWSANQTQDTYPMNDLFDPEKTLARIHEDGGYLGTDAVPTIKYWDLFYWDTAKGQEGWRRRSILDTPDVSNVKTVPNKNFIDEDQSQWLFSSGDEVYTEHREEIIQFQFADLASRAPFRYHDVKSLGWLLYAACQCQNRLRNKLMEHIWQMMMQFFRVSGEPDHERLSMLDLHDHMEVPSDVTFVTQAERWQINQNLVQFGMSENERRLQAASAQYREGRDLTSDNREKTATQVMQEVNAANALVGSMLLLSSFYETFKYREICRRACIKNSSDPSARQFQRNCLASGVPEEMLDSSTWNVEPERVLGAGNKVLQVAMADKLIAAVDRLAPDSQQDVLRIYLEANSDNPDLAERLVPREEVGNETRHGAELAVGTLLSGNPVNPSRHEHTGETIATWLHALANTLRGIQATGTPTQKDIIGIQTLAQHIGQRIQTLAQDKNQREIAKKFNKDLMGAMKIFEGIVKNAQPQQAPAGNGADPKDAAKAQAMIIQAQTKAQLAQQSHQQKTQQRQAQFVQKLKQSDSSHQMDMAKKIREAQTSAAATDLKTASELRAGKARMAKALSEGE